MALAPLLTKDQLRTFLSATTYDRLLDDNGDGTADTESADALIEYASSMIRGKVGQIATLSEVDESLRPEVTRIGLEICQARLAMRHPEVMRIDGFQLMKMAKADLKAIRINEAGLGTQDQPKQEKFFGSVVSGPSRGW